MADEFGCDLHDDLLFASVALLSIIGFTFYCAITLRQSVRAGWPNLTLWYGIWRSPLQHGLTYLLYLVLSRVVTSSLRRGMIVAGSLGGACGIGSFWTVDCGVRRPEPLWAASRERDEQRAFGRVAASAARPDDGASWRHERRRRQYRSDQDDRDSAANSHSSLAGQRSTWRFATRRKLAR